MGIVEVGGGTLTHFAVKFIQLKQKGVEPHQVQGNNGSNWIILDYHDIVVHVFYKETREFYSLERLWRDGEDVDVSKFLAE